jgi:hypothetical protein
MKRVESVGKSVASNVAPEDFRWLAKQMQNRPNKQQIAKFLLISQKQFERVDAV